MSGATGGREFDWDAARQRVRDAMRALDVEEQPDAERIRSTLRERARELAPPVHTAHADERELIAFELAGGSYAIDSHCILEISRAREIVPLPGAPAPLMGLAPWRGSILLLRDLAITLGHQATYDERPLLLVLDGDDAPVGFPVNAVIQVLNIRHEDMHPVPEGMSAPDGLVVGVVQSTVMVLDSDALLRRQLQPM
jgi:chemotaxis signal transduction protein